VMVYSEPGKHAFAPSPEWFLRRAKENRRAETQQLALHAGVLINGFTTGKIRRLASDTTLVRSYLVQQAFLPSWDFSRQFAFQPELLVPWPALLAWIPRRMTAWLARLEATIQPADYRALRLLDGGSTHASLQAAAGAGAEAVLLRVSAVDGGLQIGARAESLPLLEAFQFLLTEPMGAFLQPENAASLEALAAFIKAKDVEDYAVITSADPSLLRHSKMLLPRSITALQLDSPAQDPLRAAQETGAQFLFLRWENQHQFPSPWIETVRQAGLGVAGGPARTPAIRDALQQMGYDVVWQTAADFTNDPFQP
jgi:hypothetical protein